MQDLCQITDSIYNIVCTFHLSQLFANLRAYFFLLEGTLGSLLLIRLDLWSWYPILYGHDRHAWGEKGENILGRPEEIHRIVSNERVRLLEANDISSYRYLKATAIRQIFQARAEIMSVRLSLIRNLEEKVENIKSEDSRGLTLGGWEPTRAK